jgi:hypothetical protein
MGWYYRISGSILPRTRLEPIGDLDVAVNPDRQELAIGNFGIERHGFAWKEAMTIAGKGYIEPDNAEASPESEYEEEYKGCGAGAGEYCCIECRGQEGHCSEEGKGEWNQEIT